MFIAFLALCVFPLRKFDFEWGFEMEIILSKECCCSYPFLVVTKDFLKKVNGYSFIIPCYLFFLLTPGGKK